MMTARLTPCLSSSAERLSRLPEPKWTSSIGSMVKCPFNSCLGNESMGLSDCGGRGEASGAEQTLV